MSELTRVHTGFVFRNGGNSDATMTPRPDDVSANIQEAGLSTWRRMEDGIQPKQRGQKIDLAKLDPAVLGCFEDEHGHVSIVPVDSAGQMDMMKLTEWAATRGTENMHPFTKMVLGAIVEINVRRRK
jgi:hypothetical protein